MKINTILELKNVISRLFNVKFEAFDYSKYHQNLPMALKEIYEIDAHFSKDCRYETIRFFCNLDRLVPYNDLKLDAERFVFLHENQHNWRCKTSLNSDKVYFEDAVEPKNSKILTPTLYEFLTTFALQEIGFNLSHYMGLEANNFEAIKANFSKVDEIWLKKDYIYTKPCSFYLVEDDCLVMFAGMSIFATDNDAKFEHYKGILKHYTF
jgi:hypothetical protein